MNEPRRAARTHGLAVARPGIANNVPMLANAIARDCAEQAIALRDTLGESEALH
jgi:hypothetical protein